MSLLLSRFYPQASAVLTSGNQNISGIKNFDSRPTVRGTGVLLQGEAAGGGPITLPSDILYTTGTQTITGPKNFTARPTLSGLNLITTGDLVNLELNIEGALASSSAFNGDRQIKAIPVNNTNYGGTTISGFLERMFFPYINRTVSLNAFSTIYTYGYTSISNINFIGNLPTGDDILTGIGYYFATPTPPLLRGPEPISNSTTSYDTSVPVSTGGLSVSGTTAPTYRTRIFVTRNGVPTAIDSSSQGIRFEPPYFYGVSSNANLGLGVTGLTPSNPNTYTYALNSRPSQLPSATTFLDFTVTNGYIYFAYPSFTAPNSSIINWGPLATPLGGVVDSNNFDYTEQFNNNLVQTSINLPLYSNLNYRIYRSNLLTPINPNTLFRLRFTFA